MSPTYYIWTTEDGRFSESCLHPEATREQAPSILCTSHIHLPLLTLPCLCNSQTLISILFTCSQAQLGINGSLPSYFPLPSPLHIPVLTLKVKAILKQVVKEIILLRKARHKLGMINEVPILLLFFKHRGLSVNSSQQYSLTVEQMKKPLTHVYEVSRAAVWISSAPLIIALRTHWLKLNEKQKQLPRPHVGLTQLQPESCFKDSFQRQSFWVRGFIGN